MRLLFLGDSITDCDHCFTKDNLGTGYVKFIAQALAGRDLQMGKPETADCTSCINGGVDGFTLPRIYRKWQRMWDLQYFDAVFLLGGINDVGDIMAHGNTDACAAARFSDARDAFSALLHGLIASGCRKIFVIEPFLFSVPAELLTWRPRLDAFCQMLRSLAAQIQAEYPAVRISCISVQALFDNFADRSGAQSLTTDGVHLTEAGHRMLAEVLLSSLQHMTDQ